MTSVPSPDTTRLAPWLESNVPGFSGFESIEKFSTGQSNPTYLVCARSGRYVLRRKPSGQLLKSAHAVDREYRIMQALADTAVPVPQMYTLCEDDNIFDTMFYIMSYIEGRIFWHPSLPELATSDRGQLYDEIIRVLAELHSVDHVAVGLQDFERPGSYFDRQTGRWSKQYRASETEKIVAMEHLMTWLPAVLRRVTQSSICQQSYGLPVRAAGAVDHSGECECPIQDRRWIAAGARLPTPVRRPVVRFPASPEDRRRASPPAHPAAP